MFNGTVLRDLRKALNPPMTSKELGEKVGVTLSAVSNWETGNRVPEYAHVEKLAEFFRVDIRVFSLSTEEWESRNDAMRRSAPEAVKKRGFQFAKIGESFLDAMSDLSSMVSAPVFNSMFPCDGEYILIVNSLGTDNGGDVVVKTYSDLFENAERVDYNWVTGDAFAVKMVIRMCAAVGIDILPTKEHMYYYKFRSDRSEHDLKMIVKAITVETGFLVFICRYSLMSKGIIPPTMSPDEAALLAEYRKLSTESQRAEFAKAAKAIAEGHHCHCGGSDKMGEAGGVKPRAHKQSGSHHPSTDTTQSKSTDPSSTHHRNRVGEIAETGAGGGGKLINSSM